MRRGFFFTMDATLGIAMVTLLLGSMLLLGIATQKGGAGQAALHSSALDDADRDFLKGATTSAADITAANTAAANSITANCRDIYDYTGSGGSMLKVRKCATLG